MKKGLWGLIGLVLIIGFVVLGCATTGSNTGSAPTITKVIVATSESNADNLISASSFKKGTDILIGVEVSDPDKDIAKAGFTLTKNGISIKEYSNSGFNWKTNNESFSGLAFGANISLWNLSQKQIDAMVGTDYAVDVFFIDRKGNKSNIMSSNTFEITN